MASRRVHRLDWLAFGLIFLLAAFLRLWDLSRNGIGSPYFATTALSMALSPKLFFFGSFDPGGFVSVDKPPGGFWPPALFCALFGFSGLSVHLPQVLAGLLTLFVLWRIARRSHGVVAGLFTALFLATLPIAVVVDRSNMVDPWLVLYLTLAAGAALRGRWGQAGVFLGWAYNVKLLAALMLVPPLLGLWVVASRRAKPLLAFFAALILSGGLWSAITDLTPTEKRPYVGGSLNNTVSDLVLGYNGLGRVLGRGDQMAVEMKLPPLLYGGTPGPFRLFESRLADQWAWLLPLTLVGAFTLVQRRKWTTLMLWGGWLLVHIVVFSGAKGTFHVHYLQALGPPVAALAGVGAARSLRATPFLLAVGLLATALWQSVLAARGAGPAWQGSIALTLWPGVILAATLSLLLVLTGRPTRLPGLLGALALLGPSLLWSAVTTKSRSVSMAPFAGPQLFDPRSTLGIEEPFQPGFIQFLQKERGGAKFLVAVGSVRQAGQLILAMRQPVMTCGGFLGRDPILTPEALDGYVKRGELRFFFVDVDTQPALGEWAMRRGRPVDPARWGGPKPGFQDSYATLWDMRDKIAP
jgi:4-amino-4-deoxy-L-arabinose transferase-like glycosyltransferase